MTASQVKRKKNSLDLTDGPVFGKLIKFVLPLMAANLLQTCYNAADMMVVGLSSEQNAVGAIGMCAPFINLINNIFLGFAAGTNVIVARHLGAKDEKNASKTVHTSLMMSLLIGSIAMLVGLFISRPVISAMGAQGHLLNLSTLYTQIYFIGLPCTAASSYASAIFRANGDTKTPLYVLSTSGLSNVLLNLVFVLVFGLSVEGVALATAISKLFAAVAFIYILSKDDGPCKFSFKNCKIDRQAFFGIIKEGLPAGIQGAVFSLSNISIQSAIIQMNNTLAPAGIEYAPVVSGNASAANLGSFINTAVNSVYQASITFTSQNVGAKKFKRIKRVVITSMLTAMAVGAFGSALFILLKDPFLSLYGITKGAEGSLERIAYDTAVSRLHIVVSSYFLLGFMEVGGGVLRGLGRASLSTLNSLIGACALRILWVTFVFAAFPSLETIYISYPISWFLTGCVQHAWVIATRNKLERKELARKNDSIAS